MNNSRRLNTIFEYICAILIVLQCQSVFVNTIRPITAFVSVSSIICIFALFIMSLRKYAIHNIHVEHNLKMFYIFGGIVVILFLFIEYFFIYKFKINPLVPFFISIFFLTTYFYQSFQEDNFKSSLLYKIVNVVVFLSCSSLLFFVLNIAGLKTNVSLMNRWGPWPPNYNGYYFLDFISQPFKSIAGKVIIRNSGVFVEPSIYGFVLISALIIQIFILGIKTKKDIFKVCLIVITLISTTSSTALSICCLIFVIMLLKYILNNTKNRFVFGSGVVGSFVFLIIMYALFNDKRSNGGNEMDIHSSYAIRIDDIQACIHAWFNHMILGNGIGNNANIAKYAFSYRINSFGLSTGMFSILAYGGLVLLSIYLLSTFLILFKSKRLFVVSILINIYLVYAMIQETYLFAVFLGYFWAYILSEKTGGVNVELFSSRIRTLWSHLRLRSSKEG